VYCAGDELLPCSGFTGDQHSAASDRHKLNDADYLRDGAAPADYSVSTKTLTNACGRE
jgi:hypothetical protein